MQNLKAVHVPAIFAIPWLLTPLILFFASIKPMKEDWTKQHEARDTARQAYGSDTGFTGNWPPDGAEESPKYQAGVEDRQADEASFQTARAQREETRAAKEVELKEHTDRLDAVVSRFSRGINRDELDVTAPDLFIYAGLDLLREKEGPRLIDFFHRTYPDLFIAYSAPIAPPPINLTTNSMPQVGMEGRLDWPLGTENQSMSVWGLYPDLLNFVETFPERYDRTVQITAFTLNRVAFDHRGVTLMRLDLNFNMFAWPSGVPVGGAPPAPAGGGMMGDPGMMDPMMAPDEGGSAPASDE